MSQNNNMEGAYGKKVIIINLTWRSMTYWSFFFFGGEGGGGGYLKHDIVMCSS